MTLESEYAMEDMEEIEDAVEMDVEHESVEEQCRKLLELCQTGDWGTMGTMLEVW